MLRLDKDGERKLKVVPFIVIALHVHWNRQYNKPATVRPDELAMSGFAAMQSELRAEEFLSLGKLLHGPLAQVHRTNRRVEDVEKPCLNRCPSHCLVAHRFLLLPGVNSPPRPSDGTSLGGVCRCAREPRQDTVLAHFSPLQLVEDVEQVASQLTKAEVNSSSDHGLVGHHFADLRRHVAKGGTLYSLLFHLNEFACHGPCKLGYVHGGRISRSCHK
mmetsp:Transcript_34880/g.81547  ORF Transcript_34880/g.81547 Transcript_34880/m.81547 type:complete len:217 (-) Transcript_34880:796-1446(-)